MLAWRETRPWHDWSYPHATLHVDNRTGATAQLSYRILGDEEWDPLRLPNGADPSQVPPGDGQLRPIMLWPPGFLDRPITKACVPEPDAVHQVELRWRLPSGAEGATVVGLRLDDHVRIRLGDDGTIDWAMGSEWPWGEPRYGPAVAWP